MKLDSVRLDAIPGWATLGSALKRVAGSLEAPPILRLPPGLPAEEAMPGAGRDSQDLDAMAADLARAYMERGYFPWSPREAVKSHL